MVICTELKFLIMSPKSAIISKKLLSSSYKRGEWNPEYLYLDIKKVYLELNCKACNVKR